MVAADFVVGRADSRVALDTLEIEDIVALG
jgi:hypothetical protein